ncbi:MAG: hypothetical protein LBU65_05535 [Planctomycetaceae bacterium]|jgi:hypothetical protein|nr:hypothetical protein [Planctomycetaceae bacterium]
MPTEKVIEADNFTVQNQLKPKRGCRQIFFICLIFILIAAVPLWWFCIHTTPLQFSKETTYVTDPKTADGKWIDYLAAIEKRHYQPEMKTDDNGYRILVRACGFVTQSKTHEEVIRKQTYEKLGLAPTVQPTMKLESPDTVLNMLQDENRNEIIKKYSQQETFWTLNDFPQLENWLKENDAAINLLGEAVRKPAFCIPLVWHCDTNTMTYQLAIPLETVQYNREMVRAAYGRAKYRIGIGDIDGAIYDTITVHRLGRYASRNGTLLAAFVGIAVDNMALQIGINGNPDRPATKEQLEHYLKELDSLPPMVTFAECMESERLFGLGMLQGRFISKYNDGIPSPTLNWICDPNITFRFMNKAYDMMCESEILQRDDEIFKVSSNPLHYITVRSRSENLSRMLVSLLTPAVKQARETLRYNECTMNMKCLTLALLLYEKEHGKSPDGDWRKAVKPYLGEKPDRYLRCPSCNLEDGETIYVMIRHEIDEPVTPETMLLVETYPPQKLSEGDGVISNAPTLFTNQHSNDYTVTYRSGSVRFQNHIK